ncbi:helix-turn-helix transcriptional regulator [Longispora sp. K20-0274]|uniref:helix-turn-helix transcriptional regulator n=1 Tax=Longispora sp. K20-0274 TaxID=3088255 RepID=UPI00399BD558
MIGVLSRSLGLPASRVRTALDELNSVGAARPERAATPTGPVRMWRGRRPDAVVTSLQARHVEESQARHLLRRSLSGLELGDIMRHPDLAAPGAVRVLIGGLKVRTRLGELAPRVRRESLSITPEPTENAETVRAGAPGSLALARRGIVMRNLGVPSGPGDASRAVGVELAAAGVVFRELPQLPARIVIFDRENVIVPIDPTRPGRGALEVTAPAAVAQFVEVFNRYWDKARTPEPLTHPDIVLSARESAIVALLAEGHTDASASAELGISVRTIAYSLSELMNRCGVQNRFQLGLALGAYSAIKPATHKGDQL